MGLLAGRPACQTDPQIILDFSPTQKAQLRTNQVHIHAQNTKFALQTPQMGLSSEHTNLWQWPSPPHQMHPQMTCLREGICLDFSFYGSVWLDAVPGAGWA